MNPNKSFQQFVKDGMVGVVLALSPFVIFTMVMIFQRWGSDNFAFEFWVFIGMIFFFQYSYISPMPVVILIGFVGTGFCGLFLENITTRWSWIKPVLFISGSSWLIGAVYYKTLFGDSPPNVLWKNVANDPMITAIIIGAGALVAGVAGIIFNPAKRLPRLIIGAVASIVVGYLFGFAIFAAQTN